MCCVGGSNIRVKVIGRYPDHYGDLKVIFWYCYGTEGYRVLGKLWKSHSRIFKLPFTSKYETVSGSSEVSRIVRHEMNQCHGDKDIFRYFWNHSFESGAKGPWFETRMRLLVFPLGKEINRHWWMLRAAVLWECPHVQRVMLPPLRPTSITYEPNFPFF